ncbi:MAG: RsiV family protein, partial [Bacteroidetes bacterium]|nr:RsiV family protein [Bacteroidota bacterium]
LINKVIIFLIIIAFIGCKEDKQNEIFSDSDSVKSINFDDNQIRYYEKVYFKSYGNSLDSNDYAEVKIEYPEIITARASYDSINNYINNQILNFPLNEETYNNIDEIADSLFSSYIDVQKEFADYQTKWFINSNIKILGIFKNIISFKTEEAMFVGGANSFYNVIYSNFDISTGKIIYFEDVVNTDNLEELESIGKKIFYNIRNIPESKSLENAGYWFENKSFELNDNFAITDSGLIFFYNLYEIASRAEGTTELFLPKEKIIGLTNIYE